MIEFFENIRFKMLIFTLGFDKSITNFALVTHIYMYKII